MAPRPEVTKNVRNQSSRNGFRPELIVLHSTEGVNLAGIRDLVGLGNYFDTRGVDASSHAANDGEGNDARYVPDEQKAWTCAYYNSVSLNLEMIGKAAQKEWPAAQVKNAAEWCAYWSKKWGIPLQRGVVSNGRILKKGVITHAELGQLGGGHHDPGAGFPVDHCIALAKRSQIDPRKERVWERHLRIQRAKLKSLLALRGRLRQEKLENTARYAWTTRKMHAYKARIKKLTSLLRRG